jgi:hypothetical protein
MKRSYVSQEHRKTKGILNSLLFQIREEDPPYANYHSGSYLNPPLRLEELTAFSSHRTEVSGEGRAMI